MTNLEQVFKSAVGKASDSRGKPALMGRIDGTVHYSSSLRNMVWVRVGESDSRQEVVAICHDVSPQKDLPVRVDQVNGVLTVIGIDQKRAASFSNNRPGFNVPAHSWLHGRGGPDPLYLEGLLFLPLLVHTTTPAATMAVTVHGGAYRWGNEFKIFETSDSADLSSYIPGDNTVRHFVIICLDRVNNVIVVVDGDDITATGGDALFPTTPTLAPDDVTSIDIDAEYLPLGAIVFYYGQSAINISDIVMDLRLWGLEFSPSGWVDDGTIVRLETSTDNVSIGTASNDAKLDIRGDADEVQLSARANSTQTNNITENQASDGTALSGVTSDGILFSYGTTPNTNFVAGTLAGTPGSTGYENVGIGYNVLRNVTSGYRNVFIGVACGNAVTTGYNNLAIGRAAGNKISTGFDNVFFGGSSGQLTTGGYRNLYAGTFSGYSGTSASNNVSLGFYSLFSNTTGSGNVAIGYQAARNETGSNKLYVANTSTATPLIYGDFSTSVAEINGTLSVIGKNDAVQFVAKANSTQTANTTEFQDSSGTAGVVIDKNQDLVVNSYTDGTRPTAGTAGRIIFNTVDGQLNIDDGTNWTLPDGTTT